MVKKFDTNRKVFAIRNIVNVSSESLISFGSKVKATIYRSNIEVKVKKDKKFVLNRMVSPKGGPMPNMRKLSPSIQNLMQG